MIATLLAQFGPWIVGMLGVLGGFLALKAKSKADGKRVAAETIAKDREAIAAADIEKSKTANEKQTESIVKANDANSKVNATPIADVHSELRDKWTRD